MKNSLFIKQTHSTNVLLWEMLRNEQLPQGFVVHTDFQSAGKGQVGNSWESETGKNLLFSMVLYPQQIPLDQLFLISQLVSLGIKKGLEKYADETILKGVRHVIQGEADPDFILRKNFNRGVSLLKKYSMVYDILIVERQLPNTIKFVDQNPDQPFVLDHIAKPLIGQNELSPWKSNMAELAKRENVSCKLSGMVTEADFQNWTPSQLQPYFEVVLEAFGPERLLFGSDWPVCLVATTYKNWKNLVQENISSFSETEQAKIMGENAIRIYKL